MTTPRKHKIETALLVTALHRYEDQAVRPEKRFPSHLLRDNKQYMRDVITVRDVWNPVAERVQWHLKAVLRGAV